jgi:hypothetical protein
MPNCAQIGASAFAAILTSAFWFRIAIGDSLVGPRLYWKRIRYELNSKTKMFPGYGRPTPMCMLAWRKEGVPQSPIVSFPTLFRQTCVIPYDLEDISSVLVVIARLSARRICRCVYQQKIL